MPVPVFPSPPSFPPNDFPPTAPTPLLPPSCCVPPNSYRIGCAKSIGRPPLPLPSPPPLLLRVARPSLSPCRTPPHSRAERGRAKKKEVQGARGYAPPSPSPPSPSASPHEGTCPIHEGRGRKMAPPPLALSPPFPSPPFAPNPRRLIRVRKGGRTKVSCPRLFSYALGSPLRPPFIPSSRRSPAPPSPSVRAAAPPPLHPQFVPQPRRAAAPSPPVRAAAPPPLRPQFTPQRHRPFAPLPSWAHHPVRVEGGHTKAPIPAAPAPPFAPSPRRPIRAERGAHKGASPPPLPATTGLTLSMPPGSRGHARAHRPPPLSPWPRHFICAKGAYEGAPPRFLTRCAQQAGPAVSLQTHLPRPPAFARHPTT
ncbi:hypothetical protein H4582DRAFT_2069335 [Lactarius indigo]|nr:hypothetical protein H4582DRAFT_2069335 [Lactarius indigo]